METLEEEANPYWHWLHDYTQRELYAGGPDPQIKTVATALERYDDVTAARFAGVFVNCYTCAGAAAQWRELLHKTYSLNWLCDHWGLGLPIRKERRSVKGTVKFLRSHESWQDWVTRYWSRVRQQKSEVVFDSIEEHVQYFGRYATMKVVETLYQRSLLADRQQDMRPRGAKFPRRTLAKLFPDLAEQLLDKRETQAQRDLSESLAVTVKDWLENAGLELNWYQLETVLCTFRQACGQNKYPGRSQDRELMYFQKAQRYWEQHDVDLLEVLPFYQVRRKLFDPQWLGEVRGWTGPREELEASWVAQYPEGVRF